MSDFELGGGRWASRLIMGTGGFRSLRAMEEAIEASGAEIVTVALRRIDVNASGSVIDSLRRGGRFLLPNTAGWYTAHDARPTPPPARGAVGTGWGKLEGGGGGRPPHPGPPGRPPPAGRPGAGGGV